MYEILVLHICAFLPAFHSECIYCMLLAWMYIVFVNVSHQVSDLRTSSHKWRGSGVTECMYSIVHHNLYNNLNYIYSTKWWRMSQQQLNSTQTRGKTNELSRRLTSCERERHWAPHNLASSELDSERTASIFNITFVKLSAFEFNLFITYNISEKSKLLVTSLFINYIIDWSTYSKNLNNWTVNLDLQLVIVPHYSIT